MIPSIHRAQTAPLITCKRFCLRHQHQVPLLMAAWNYSNCSHDTEIIQASPELISSICFHKATLLHALRMWSSLVSDSSWKGAPGSHCLSSAGTKCLQMARNAGMSKWSATKHLRRVSYRETTATANREEISFL